MQNVPLQGAPDAPVVPEEFSYATTRAARRQLSYLVQEAERQGKSFHVKILTPNRGVPGAEVRSARGVPDDDLSQTHNKLTTNSQQTHISRPQAVGTVVLVERDTNICRLTGFPERRCSLTEVALLSSEWLDCPTWFAHLGFADSAGGPFRLLKHLPVPPKAWPDSGSDMDSVSDTEASGGRP